MAIISSPDHRVNAQYYKIIGAQWGWTDRLTWTAKKWQEHAYSDTLITAVGMLNGKKIGYVELEAKIPGEVEILYFGLLPNFIGQQLGGPLLSAVVECAWNIPETQRVWLHTCTLDHDHALSNYRARGFRIFKIEVRSG